MPVRTAQAVWEGNLIHGKGQLSVESGAFTGKYSFQSRFESGTGTNPEELIGAAHAGCFSMALAHNLDQAGYAPEEVRTSANVKLAKTEDGHAITDIELNTEVSVPGIDDKTFQSHADDAKRNCPVSKALAGVNITLHAKLM